MTDLFLIEGLRLQNTYWYGICPSHQMLKQPAPTKNVRWPPLVVVSISKSFSVENIDKAPGPVPSSVFNNLTPEHPK